MNKRTIIVSGGMLEEEFVLSILKSQDTEFIIGVDKGIEFLYKHKISPNYIVGDFDSVSEDIITYYTEETKVPIKRLHPVKDASDTEVALRLCLEMERKNIVILGATGTRIDHVWANVQTLKIGLDKGEEVCIMAAHNRIRLLNRGVSLHRKTAFGSYFSFFPLGGEVQDFSIQGAKYPLSHATLLPFDSLCVSNEFAEDEVKVTFSEGIVILMETRD